MNGTQERKIFQVTKEKTSCRGFWKNDSGKVFIDRIKVLSSSRPEVIEAEKQALFDKGEEAVFIRESDRALIYDRAGNVTELKHNIIFYRENLSFNEIKTFISIYGGLTIYKIGGLYLIEAWQK
jgi:hypothetical protein